MERKQFDSYHVRTLIFRSGERLPLLVDRSGIPLHGPNVFTIAEVRNRHRAANTMANVLGALSIFERFLDQREIRINGRLEDGKLLELGEIEELIRFCRIDFSTHSSGPGTVSSPVSALRLRTIRKYLEWLVKERVLREESWLNVALQERFRLTIETINARIPPASDVTEPREGLTDAEIELVETIIAPSADLNPWRSTHSRVRNYLIWNVLRYLGIRGGELLGIRIHNLDFRRGILRILRQPDLEDDPRRRQPNTKTRARDLHISPVLQKQVSDYIFNHRRLIDGAQKHDFLFVSSSGSPMSYSAYNKIFRVLKAKYPQLPPQLTGHVLRHTWNDRFSEEMDVKGVPEEMEKKVRDYHMGWKATSDTASVYTRRFVRRKAQEVSVELQQKLAKDSK